MDGAEDEGVQRGAVRGGANRCGSGTSVHLEHNRNPVEMGFDFELP
jgi:hypothetical protein